MTLPVVEMHHLAGAANEGSGSRFSAEAVHILREA